MLPRSRRGARRGAHVGQRGAQAGEARRVVGPLAGQQPARIVVGERIERRKIESDPLGHDRKSELGEESEVVPHGAFEGDGGCRRPGRAHRVAPHGPVGVRVVVEEQVEARRSAEVEQGQGLGPSVTRRDVAEAGQQAGAAPDLVGLGRAGGDQPLDLGAVLLAEVGEGRCCAAGRPGRPLGAAHRRHRVVERGQWVLDAGEEQEMHGRQEQERAPLG